VTPTVVQSTANVDALVAAMRASHPNDNVLIVGHSNTIPAILKALSGTTIEIAESDYGNLIVVVPATRAVTTLRF
jgi:broad specificity phosphatase PhoE